MSERKVKFVPLFSLSSFNKRRELTLVKKPLISDSILPIPKAIVSLRILSLSSDGAFVATILNFVATRMVSSGVGAIDGIGVGKGLVGIGVPLVGVGVGALDGVHVNGVGSLEIDGTVEGIGDGMGVGLCVGSCDTLGEAVGVCVGRGVGVCVGTDVGCSDGDSVGSAV